MSNQHTSTSLRHSLVQLACLSTIALAGASGAAPISFTQIPAGATSKEPAPNVIISVDDSGSMAWDVTTDSATITTGKKMTLLKDALKAEFGDGTANSGKIPDGRIRLAWQAMHNNGSATGAGSLTPGATNAIRPFQGAHRTNFNTFINSLTTGNGTPSLKMMKNVYSYGRASEGIDSPWANDPSNGTVQTTPYLACRRMYHVFMTDGAWNGQSDSDRVSKGDSTTQTLPDGKSYSVTSNQTRPYRDAWGDGDPTNGASKAHTLADFAFRNWATDMQDGSNGTQNMANQVRPLTKQTGDVTYSTTTCAAANNCAVTQEYWNPKNDPANWQHVTQYTIGFGLGAVNWPYVKSDNTLSTSTASADINGRKTPSDWDYNNTTGDNYAGDFPRLVQGELVWPNVFSYDTSPSGTEQDQRTVELWHAALNGRGRYYPAKTVEALTAAFDDIMNTVIGDTSKNLLSIATSSSYLRSGLYAYIGGFDSTKYSGALSARPLDPVTGAIMADVSWDAGAIMDALANSDITNRFVASYNGSAGISWKTYSALPTAMQTPMNKNSAGTVDSKGQDRVDFIRGDRTKETQNGGTFRERGSRLGDIVNSNIWYVGKPASGYSANNYDTFRGTGTGGKGGRVPMVYVGANDGMLHGVVATTTGAVPGGKELLAYIPQGVAQGELRKLTDIDYTHKYYVDGAPFTGDAYIGSTPTWKTVLVGALAAGGKGYFVLDVTDPADFTTTNVANLVITDTTASTDADLGNIFSVPAIESSTANFSSQIVKLNNDRWAVVMGNGYNSTNEAPVLVIQYLDGDKAIKKISPCTFPTSGACSYKGTNGLSVPQMVDLNGDGKADIAYAGDLKGNVWKFNLTSSSDSAWSTSFSGAPLFVAMQSAGVTQAITAAPFWAYHPNGGIMLAVGTGRNLSDTDQTSSGTESVYGLWDNSTFTVSGSTVTVTDGTVINTTASTSLPSTLIQQTIDATFADNGTNYYKSSNNAVTYTGTTPNRGWYMNWTISGQRILQNIFAFSGQKILVSSTIPKAASTGGGETCSPSATSERNFASILNLYTGNVPELSPFTMTDTANSTNLVSMREGAAGDTTYITSGDKLISVNPSGCKAGEICGGGTGGSGGGPLNLGGYVGTRANWRVDN